MFKKEDENYVYELVSRNFKRIRKDKGLSKKEIAEKVDCTAQFLGNIESPRYHQTFSLETVYLFAKALDIDIRDLFDDTQEKGEN